MHSHRILGRGYRSPTRKLQSRLGNTGSFSFSPCKNLSREPYLVPRSYRPRIFVTMDTRPLLDAACSAPIRDWARRHDERASFFFSMREHCSWIDAQTLPATCADVQREERIQRSCSRVAGKAARVLSSDLSSQRSRIQDEP